MATFGYIHAPKRSHAHKAANSAWDPSLRPYHRTGLTLVLARGADEEMSKKIATRVRIEPEPIKRSRHIATALPIAGPDDLGPALDAARAEFPGANHHAWAMVTGTVVRCSDDGEPSGSAGRPILARIDGAQLTDVLIIVSRIFGGTKLGVGGLVRAYGGAAAAAIDAAQIVEYVPMRSGQIRHDYALADTVARLLPQFEATEGEVTWAADVHREVTVPETRWDELDAALRDASNGAVGLAEAPSRP